MLCTEASQKQRQDALRILTERVASAGNAPIVHQAAFEHGIGFCDVVDGKLFFEKIKLFAFADNLAQKLIISTARTHHVFFAAGDKLRSEKLAQQVNGYRVVDHQEQFLIHKDQFFNRSERGVHRFGKFIVFFIKKIGKRREKCVFPIKIVNKRSLWKYRRLLLFPPRWCHHSLADRTAAMRRRRFFLSCCVHFFSSSWFLSA